MLPKEYQTLASDHGALKSLSIPVVMKILHRKLYTASLLSFCINLEFWLRTEYLFLYKKTANRGGSGPVAQEAANVAAFKVEDDKIAVFRWKQKGKVQLQIN